MKVERLTQRPVQLTPGLFSDPNDVKPWAGTPQLISRIRDKLVNLAHGTPKHTSVVIPGSGTAALEAALVSLIPPSGKILVLNNGYYGDRIYRIVKLQGIRCIIANFGWMQPIDLSEVTRILREDSSISHIGMVHHETPTGMLNPLEAINDIASAFGVALIVDAISSIGSETIDLRATNVDWVVGTASKNLHGPWGVSFVIGQHAELENFPHTPKAFYLNLHRHYAWQEHNVVPMPVPEVTEMAEFERALDSVLAESDDRITRFKIIASELRRGLMHRGFRLLLDEEHMSNTVVDFQLLSTTDYLEFCSLMKSEGFLLYGVQESQGVIMRIMNTGQLNNENTVRFFHAIDRTLTKLNRGIFVSPDY